MIQTSFTMKRLDSIRKHGVEMNSSEYSCKCGLLKLIVGSHPREDDLPYYCLYSHGELLFTVPDLDRYEDRQDLVAKFLKEIGCAATS